MRKSLSDFLAKRYAINSGHHHIAKDDVEAMRFLLNELECLFRIGRKHGLIAKIEKKLRGEFTDLCVVLYHQDARAYPRTQRIRIDRLFSVEWAWN